MTRAHAGPVTRATHIGHATLIARAARAAATVIVLIATAAAAATSFTGCSAVRIGVDPWDRDLLAQQIMVLDSNPARDGNDAHIYFSREAASGGRGYGGGGCGCN